MMMCASMATSIFLDICLVLLLLIPPSVTDSTFANHGETPTTAPSSSASKYSDTEREAVTVIYAANGTVTTVGGLTCFRKLPTHEQNFRFKYSQSVIKLWFCKCRNASCGGSNATEVNEAILKEVHESTYRNKDKIALVVSIFTVLLVIGLIGNVLTIVGLLRWVKKSSPTFAFIISLSLSDLLLLCVCMPLKVTEFFYFSGIFTEWTCKFSCYVRDFTLVCSVLTLTVISFERYYAICHPLIVQYRCTMFRARIIILVTWCVSFCLATPSIFMAKFYTPLGMIYRTCLPMSSSVDYLRLHFVYYLGVLFVLPMIVMTVAYGRSCYSLWKSTLVSKELQGARAHGHNVKSNHADSDDQSRKQVVKILILIVIVFLVCWGPPLIVQVLVVTGKITRNREEIRLAVETLTYVSSTLNPYLFMAMSSQFRHAAFRCLRRLRRGTGYHETSTPMPTVTTSAMESSIDNTV